MSEQRPEDSTQSFEYLGDAAEQTVAPEARPRRGRRALIGVTIGALLAAGAAGAFAVAQFLDGGPSAASAAPSNVLGFLAVDLDPSGGQKLAAYQTLKKFPALEDRLGLSSEEDLRSWVFEGLFSESGCDRVDVGDVDSWLGNAFGVGVVPGKDEPTVFFALEVTDRDRATTGVRELAECAGEGEVGTAVVGDFMVVAETAGEAADVAQSAEESPLADDPTYQERTGEAGEDGVATGYLAPSFGDFMSEQLSNMGGMFGGGTVQYDAEAEAALAAGRAGALAEDLDEPGVDGPGQQGDFGEGYGPGMPPVAPFMMGFGPGMLLGGLGGGLGDLEAIADELADFGGAAMQVRFADESLELELASHGLDGQMAETGTVDLGDLPSGTGLALGMATGEDWADALVEGLRMADPQGFDRSMREGSEETGLALPEDIAGLVGDSVTVAFDSGVDFPGLFESFFFGPDPGDGLAAGLRITGDPATITPLVEKLATYAAEQDGPQLVWAESEGAVAVGFDQGYVDTLAAGGDLRGSEAFARAMPDEEVVSGAFADFDADHWLDRAVEGGSKDEKANVEPLSSFGLTTTRDGDTVHATIRLTTD